MPVFATFANDLLDQQHANAASGTDVIGATTYQLPYRVQFCSTVCTDTAVGTALGSPVSIAGSFANAAASKAKSNSAAISLTGAPAGTWADVAQIDSSGTPKPMVFKGTPSLGKSVNAGDTLVIPSGQWAASYTT